MNYYTYREFNGKAICGQIVIPISTVVTEEANMIKYDNKKICLATSTNAHKHFVANDDNNGAVRGNLIISIQSKLTEVHYVEETDEEGNTVYVDHIAQQRHETIDNDEICQKYVISTSGKIIWNNVFYSASISDLEHINEIIISV